MPLEAHNHINREIALYSLNYIPLPNIYLSRFYCIDLHNVAAGYDDLRGVAKTEDYCNSSDTLVILLLSTNTIGT